MSSGQGAADAGEIAGPNNLNGSISSTKTIGKVIIGGDVTNVNIVAGIKAGDDKQFGVGSGLAADADLNPGLISSIAKVVIKGAVTATGQNHFAIEANQIGSVQIGAKTFAHSNPDLNF